MRIEFVQSGGVAGLPRPLLTIDTDSLSDEQSRIWQELVRAADFFNLPPSTPPSPRRDSFSYRITINADGRQHTIQTCDGAGPPALDALLEQLRQAHIRRLTK
jgi:hypothetical protein